MSFFKFDQNNTGGGFAFDIDNGLTHLVFIEAITAREANDKAEAIGIYFNGCDAGHDCPCCGDRWYPVDDDDARSEPLYYGKPIQNGMADEKMKWMPNGKEACVHYLDGRLEWF